MQAQHEENIKDKKTFIIIGGANTLLTLCQTLSNMIEAVKNGSVLRLFAPPSPINTISWAVINLAILWKFHEIGKQKRWVDNTIHDAASFVQTTANNIHNSIKNKTESSASILPSKTDVDIFDAKMENMYKNIIEGGAACYETITQSRI